MEEKVDTKALAFSPNASKEEAAVKEEDVKMEPDDEEDEDEDYVGGEKGEKKKRKRWTPPEGGPCEWCGMTFKEPSYLRDHQLRRCNTTFVHRCSSVRILDLSYVIFSKAP